MTSHLVTGGAGFIGSALVKTLVHEGHQVTVLDDFSRGQDARIEGLGATVIHGDVRDLNTVLVAIQGCESVIHMAFKQGTESFYAEPRQVLDVAIRGITNVLLACELTACRDLLLVSSSEAYQSSMQIPTPETVPLSVPDPLNPRYSYAGGKIASELMALAWQRAGVLDRVIIARPHNIFGPDMGREHVVPEFAIRMNRLVADYHPDEILPFRIQGTGPRPGRSAGSATASTSSCCCSATPRRAGDLPRRRHGREVRLRCRAHRRPGLRTQDQGHPGHAAARLPGPPAARQLEDHRPRLGSGRRARLRRRDLLHRRAGTRTMDRPPEGKVVRCGLWTADGWPSSSTWAPSRLAERYDTFRTYPLALLECVDCGLIQLSWIVPQHVLFPDATPTPPARRRAGHALPGPGPGHRRHPEVRDMVVDIGANDGTLLSLYPPSAARIAVEPTDQAA